MAEIRSTLEMVLARAARMEAQASAASDGGEEREKEGMRLAAAFMRNEPVDLAAALAAAGPEALHCKRGMVSALLRNILLPRHGEELTLAEKAMRGLMELARGVAELAPVFPEMTSILNRYQSHQEQLKKQLEEQFAQQMAMMEKTLAQQTGMKMKLQPAQHPKFAEEWQRIRMELQDQYGRALNQYKEYINKLLVN